MKSDIRTADDIGALVRAFYERARPDPVIGHFFVDLDWKHHIPRITSFWCMVLLGDRAFQGDPMTAHILLNRRMPMQQAHFDQWLALWQRTVDELFKGPNAEVAKDRARTIAAVMARKISAAG